MTLLGAAKGRLPCHRHASVLLWACTGAPRRACVHLTGPQGAKQLRVTRKASLLSAAAAGLLPSSLEGVAEGGVLAGYVASVTRDAVFVR